VGVQRNHESPWRPPTFVSRKIVQGALDVRSGRVERLAVADLAARVDWGYAPDFVDAMVRIATLEEAGDFVVATGEAHSVQEFAEVAFRSVGLDWRKHVVEVPSSGVRRRPTLVGNASLLRARTGWKPSVSFEEMVEALVCRTGP
jgi:GDPmannose 4,6-dehydratase